MNWFDIIPILDGVTQAKASKRTKISKKLPSRVHYECEYIMLYALYSKWAQKKGVFRIPHHGCIRGHTTMHSPQR